MLTKKVQDLCRERRSTAAAAGRIWILECESRAHHIGCVVDGDTVKILGREHIDKQPNALLVHNEITHFRLFLDVEAVLKARTTARHNANTKPGCFRQVILAGEEFLDLYRCAICNY